MTILYIAADVIVIVPVPLLQLLLLLMLLLLLLLTVLTTRQSEAISVIESFSFGQTAQFLVLTAAFASSKLLVGLTATPTTTARKRGEQGARQKLLCWQKVYSNLKV